MSCRISVFFQLTKKMRILLSWIAFNNDLRKNPKTGKLGGPTLEILREEQFDVLHLFSSDRASQDKASKLKRHVEENPQEFNIKKIVLEFVALISPADYRPLWEKIPVKVGQILRKYETQNPEVLINLSAGTPAMSATWMMMVGTGQLQAKLLNAQINRDSGKVSVETVDSGIYPFVRELQEKADQRLGVSQKYRSAAMQKILRELTILAQGMGRPVLLLGETGTGKTTLARQFHVMSGKPENHFQHVVCGEFRGADLNLVKSQLFGHVKGAFTGAETTKSGMLTESDGGTLFLDEIGDIPLEVQRLLIDAVESKRFRALGSHDVQESDFQLICATNRDIEELLQTSELSQDFHFRISSFRYIIPPLRERPEDIPVILTDLLKTVNYRKMEFEETAMDELIHRLQQSSLSGNVRDVQRILDHLVLQTQIPEPHPLTLKEISNYFTENREPTQDEYFLETVHELLQQWPQTSFAKRGEKWRDAVLNVALKELVERPEYKKKSGELNIHKLATLLGVDHKTIKSRNPNA